MAHRDPTDDVNQLPWYQNLAIDPEAMPEAMPERAPDPTDGGTAPENGAENDELDVRPVCERCHERKAVAEMDWLSADGVDWWACASCRDALDRQRQQRRPQQQEAQ